eukprot:TRINITY_DN4581_c0_g1_i8.p1 TRINITY_DN4581_c0_g1~~TRINITY_DN4581_c0_g1_i8.p1  ORF type:complete len:134 (+),score=5.26 TRINITY_DN4581_c0_g1_i8:77-478(+)
MGTFKNKERMEIEANNDPPFRPFIIRRGVPKTLIPEESKVFDETVERNVRFIQGANAFIILGLSYESLKLLYLHYAYRSECEDFSYLILAIIFNNILWIFRDGWQILFVHCHNNTSTHRHLRWNSLCNERSSH